jgi:hypothetical protein
MDDGSPVPTQYARRARHFNRFEWRRGHSSACPNEQLADIASVEHELQRFGVAANAFKNLFVEDQ